MWEGKKFPLTKDTKVKNTKTLSFEENKFHTKSYIQGPKKWMRISHFT